MDIGTTRGEIEYVAPNRGIGPRGIRSNESSSDIHQARMDGRLDASVLRGRLPVWVINGPEGPEITLPFHPQKRTCS